MNSQDPDLCIYHGQCSDGFTAAWAVRFRYPNIEFFPATYGDHHMPDVKGRHVVMVDFSYKADTMARFAEEAASLTILDHHKSAQTAVEPLLLLGKIGGVFDMDRSGAGIAWDWMNPGIPRPKIVDYVEDRDLWRHKLDKTHEINTYLSSWPRTFEKWDQLARELDTASDLDRVIIEGSAILRKFYLDLDELLEHNTQWTWIGGQRVPTANVSFGFASHAGNRLALIDGAPFGATYYENSRGDRVYSLRSIDTKEDVSKVAELYGGGGHRNASGFRVTQDQRLKEK